MTAPPAGDSDEVVQRVLAALRRAEAAGVPTLRRVHSGDSLPRRVPGTNLAPRQLPVDHPTVRIVRDAQSVAANATGYMRGWRRGQEVARRTRFGPAAAPAAAVAVAPAPPVARPARRARVARLRPAAMRLVRLVVRVLPEAERPRYHEEFRAEMSELGPIQQVAYAVRLLVSAPALRRSLGRTRPRVPGDGR